MKCVEKDPSYLLHFYRYVLSEYPAELLMPSGTDGTSQKSWLVQKSFADIVEKQHTAHAKWFAKVRIWDIRVTSVYYAILFTLCALQLAILVLSPVLSSQYEVMHWPIIILKGISLVLCAASWFAWSKQLTKDVEYYAWAVGNYSQSEPLYETLRLLLHRDKTNPTDAMIVIADWLKNRPSIIYLLVTCSSIVSLHHVLYACGVAEFTNRWMVWGAESVLGLVFFLISIPCTTWLYLKEMKKTTSVVPVICTGLILFLVLFELPISVSNAVFHQDGRINEWISVGVVVALGIAIYVGLLLGKGCYQRKLMKQEQSSIHRLVEMLCEGKGAWEEIGEAFLSLSCNGQIRFLLRLQGENYDTLPKEGFDQLTKNAKTCEVIDLIHECYCAEVTC